MWWLLALGACKDGGGDTADTDTRSNGDPPPDVEIVINEFMASNQTSLPDPDSATDPYPDWIELYNPGSTDVALDGFSITDDLANPDKHGFADGMAIPAGGFLLLFADGDSDATQGDDHVTFELQREGEEIGVFYDAARYDAVQYDEQQTDIASYRWPDGGDRWVYTLDGTPGAPNAPEPPA